MTTTKFTARHSRWRLALVGAGAVRALIGGNIPVSPIGTDGDFTDSTATIDRYPRGA